MDQLLILRGGGFDDIPDDDERTIVTDDVVYDTQIYDYVLPATKTVHELSVSAKPGGGGVVVERIHPVKYAWAKLPEMQDHLIGIFPEDLRQPTPAAVELNLEGTGVASEPAAAEVGPDADVHQSPFPASSGIGEDVEDTAARPESFTEIDILKKLLQVDFSHPSWTGFESTHWQSYPGFYLVYKPKFD